MRQRITYILPEGSNVHRADLKVSNDSLNFTKAGEAAEEWRLTLGLDDLPEELQTILRDCHELHLRWVSSRNDQLLSPVVSRLPPGLHAFFTPGTAAQDVSLCSLLRDLLRGKAAKCTSVAESFSRPQLTSERFATSSTYQYYQYSPIDMILGAVLLGKICDRTSSKTAALDACDSQIQELQQASSIDVDFDAISHALTLTAFWSSPNTSRNEVVAQRASRGIRKLEADDRLEVGVLQSEKATEPEELSLGGYLTVIGDDDHPSTTLFSFPSRHHPMPIGTPATFKATFRQPTGLHPKLDITLPRQLLAPPRETCGLHAYLSLPSALFIDRYQLSDRIFLASQNLIALHSLSGGQDLEAPDWAVKRWGSAALLQLGTPRYQTSSADKNEAWNVTIPMHLRYLSGPTQQDGKGSEMTVEVPWPVTFWACEAEEGLKMSTNPFDRVNLGYDGLFGPKTMFYHLSPSIGVKRMVEEIKVPILNVDEARWVPVGTLIAVVAGFVWVCWQLWRTAGFESKKRGAQGKKTE